jgi:hypothetical protein
VAEFAVARDPEVWPNRPRLLLLSDPVAKPDEAELVAIAEFHFLGSQFRGTGE